MSLRSNSCVRLRVDPCTVSGSLERGWLRPRVIARAEHEVQKAPGFGGASGSGASPLMADALGMAIDAVAGELRRASPFQGASLHVAWADSLTHFDVAEGDFAGDSDRQLQSVAQACVSELLGDAVASYNIRWQLQSDGRHLLIAALLQEHLSALADAATRHGLRLRSVAPEFCLQWNRHADALKSGPGVFAVAWENEAMIACVDDGAVTSLSAGPWIDTCDPFRESDFPISRLMSGFRLGSRLHQSLLDVRVDRMLASIGRDPATQSNYVLVAPELPEAVVSSRWTLLNREATPS